MHADPVATGYEPDDLVAGQRIATRSHTREQIADSENTNQGLHVAHRWFVRR